MHMRMWIHTHSVYVPKTIDFSALLCVVLKTPPCSVDFICLQAMIEAIKHAIVMLQISKVSCRLVRLWTYTPKSQTEICLLNELLGTFPGCQKLVMFFRPARMIVTGCSMPSFVCVCVCVCVYTSVYKWEYACLYMYIYICVCVCVCVCVWVRVGGWVYVTMNPCERESSINCQLALYQNL